MPCKTRTRQEVAMLRKKWREEKRNKNRTMTEQERKRYNAKRREQYGKRTKNKKDPSGAPSAVTVGTSTDDLVKVSSYCGVVLLTM